MIHCDPKRTDKAPEAQAASVCIVGMPCKAGSISGTKAPRCSCFVNPPALKFPTAAACISAGSIFASSIAFRDQIADRFSFLLQVALKIGSAAAEDVNRFHRLVCPVGWIPEREYERG